MKTRKTSTMKISTMVFQRTRHRHMLLILLGSLLVLVTAQNSWAFNKAQPLENHPVMDLRHCEQLYARATELEARSQNRESSIYSAQNNNVASVVSTVFTPALYFLGFSKIKQFTSRHQAMESLHELDAVRNRMAALRCFQ